MAKNEQNRGTEYVALPKGSFDTGQEEPITDEEMAFDEFVAGMSAERMGELRVGKIKVAKDGTPVANTRSAHCFSCPIDQFTYSGLVEHIRGRHGAGLYRVVGVETGKRGLVFNRLLEIAEELNPQRPSENPLQNPANYLESVGKIMAESQARTEGLIARLTESKPAALDPMAMMTQMATLFATIMGVVPKPVAQADDLLGQLEKLAKVKELLGGFGGESGSAAEANFYDVVKTSVQAFGPALAALAVKSAQSGAPNGAIALGPPDGTQTVITAPPRAKQPGPTRMPINNPGEAGMSSLKRQVDILVQNAKMGADPMALAGTILDMTPDEKLDDLETMLNAPDMIEKMGALNPEVQVHREFFVKLRESLLTLLNEDGSDTLPASAPIGVAPGSTGAPTA